MAKSPFSLPFGVNNITRPGGLKWSYLILGPPTTIKPGLHNNQLGEGNVWRRGMTGRDHFIDPHAPNCINFEMQNLLSWAGDIQLQYQNHVTINCAVRIRWRNAYSCRNASICGMEEHVGPIVLDYCYNNGGTAVPTSMALDGPSSSKGSHQH